MNEEKQADRLARWLDEALAAGGTPPDAPADLDDDVREAIAALRPDRAPAPRLTADDLLASLQAGPLAAPQPVVIPFPSPAAARSRRMWRSVGGAGGVGLMLAAAGVLYLFGVDRSALQAPPPPEMVAVPEEAPAAAAVEQKENADVPAEPIVGGRLEDNAIDARSAVREAPRPSKESARSAGADAPAAEAPLPLAPTGQGIAGAIAESQKPAARALPPEDLGGAAPETAAPSPGLAEMGEVTTAEPNAAAGYYRGQSPKQAETRDRETRKAEKSADEAPPPPAAAPPVSQVAQAGWAAGVDPVALAGFDAARGKAQSLAAQGRFAEAAATLATVVHAPARAGQYHAKLAADYWLQAGDPAAAVAIAMQGLQLSSADSPERNALLSVLSRAEAAQPKLDRQEMMDDQR
jgi:hypothetical protein